MNGLAEAIGVLMTWICIVVAWWIKHH